MTARGDTGSLPVGTSLIDQHGAVLTATGVISAIYDRSITGNGHKIDISLLDATLDLQMEPLAYYMNAKDLVATRRASTGLGSRIHPSPYGVYKPADG
jgi:crotonobetainyl-CoA:carnitine CoA-transferase CaiB-like acyl-CoA transferase